jgi:hypothetical protein
VTTGTTTGVLGIASSLDLLSAQLLSVQNVMEVHTNTGPTNYLPSLLFYMPAYFFAFALLLGCLLPGLARAQASAPVPRWTMADLTMQQTGRSFPYPVATAVDEAGNVFTAGMFYDTASFGSHRLYSAGGNDFYVAKYVLTTHTLAWAMRGGVG